MKRQTSNIKKAMIVMVVLLSSGIIEIIAVMISSHCIQ